MCCHRSIRDSAQCVVAKEMLPAHTYVKPQEQTIDGDT